MAKRDSGGRVLVGGGLTGPSAEKAEFAQALGVVAQLVRTDRRWRLDSAKGVDTEIFALSYSRYPVSAGGNRV